MNRSVGRGRGRGRRGTEEKVGGAQSVRSLPPLPVPRWLQQSPPPRSPEFPSLNEDVKEPEEPESDNREREHSVKGCGIEGKDSSIGGVAESLTKLSIDDTQAIFGASDSSSSSDSTPESVEAHVKKKFQKSPPHKPVRRPPPPVKKAPTGATKSFLKDKKQVPSSWYQNEWRICPYFTSIMSHQHDMSIPYNKYLFKCRAKYWKMQRRLGEEMDIEICRYHSGHHVPISELEEHEKDCCFRKR